MEGAVHTLPYLAGLTTQLLTLPTVPATPKLLPLLWNHCYVDSDLRTTLCVALTMDLSTALFWQASPFVWLAGATEFLPNSTKMWVPLPHIKVKDPKFDLL